MAATVRTMTASWNTQNSVHTLESATSARPLCPHDTRVTIASMMEPRKPMASRCSGPRPSTSCPKNSSRPRASAP